MVSTDILEFVKGRKKKRGIKERRKERGRTEVAGREEPGS